MTSREPGTAPQVSNCGAVCPSPISLFAEFGIGGGGDVPQIQRAGYINTSITNMLSHNMQEQRKCYFSKLIYTDVAI